MKSWWAKGQRWSNRISTTRANELTKVLGFDPLGEQASRVVHLLEEKLGADHSLPKQIRKLAAETGDLPGHVEPVPASIQGLCLPRVGITKKYH